MTRDALVGVDLGQTRTKAVVFDLQGRVLGSALDATEAEHRRPRWAERELAAGWERTAAVIATALRRAGTSVHVLAVGVSGHSDGLYLVDEDGRPTRPAVLATDARAREQAEELAAGASGSRLLGLTGQVPMPASPAALLRWLREHEPHVLDRTRWVLSSTDWLRLGLTGTVTTDLTMAATGFVPLGSGTWGPEALAAHGVDELMPLLPPVRASDAIAGVVTREAARRTGLREGTPVVTGAHDVDTGAFAMGATTGSATVLLGTYSINQVLGAAPVPDPRWQVRPFLESGSWLHMSTSPAGAGCLDWVAGRIGPWDAAGRADSGAAVAEAATVEEVASGPLFLPYVHGGRPGTPLGGSWIGLRSEHGRSSLLHAVLEGVAFSHRWHLEALGSRLPLPPRLVVGGGGARSAVWTQLLSDTLRTELLVTESEEVSALGAALLAGVGVGAYAGPAEAVAAAVRVGRHHDPDPDRGADLDRRYDLFCRATETVSALDLG